MGIKGFVKQVLAERENRRYGRELESRKVPYGDWVAGLERQDVQEAAPGDRKDVQEAAPGCGQDGQKATAAYRTDEQKPIAECRKEGCKNAAEMYDRSSEFVIICAGEGTLSAGVCAYIGDYFADHPEAQLVYGDEDVCDGIRKGENVEGQRRHTPWFKPDWSPDLLDSFFYFGSVVAVRKSLWESGLGTWKSFGSYAGVEIPAFLQAIRYKEAWADTDGVCAAGSDNAVAGPDAAGGQDAAAEPDAAAGPDATKTVRADMIGNVDIYEAVDYAEYEKWVHICVMLAGGYQIGCRAIGHVQRILFHCNSVAEQEKFLQCRPCYEESMEEQLQEFRNHYGISGERGAGAGNGMEAMSGTVISVVIPSKDQPKILEKCVEGCMLAAGTVPFEIIIVDNGSSEENRKRIRDMIGRKSGVCPGHINYLYEPQEFNFSRMCNQGAEQAKGDFLLFLNDDVELCLAGAMEKMAALAERGCTGAVGIKLYYPDSICIQHAGITNLPMGPVHKLQFLEDDKSYYYGANRGRRNVLAVTAACLMVERDKYTEAGGFSEELRVAFNDVDFCFRLYGLGYQNVCMNDLYGYHHESLSRGADESAEKLGRLLRERDKLYERHPGLEGVDPYYSPCLNREGLDTGIRPAYLTAGNAVQRVTGRMAVMSLAKYRQDNCLMVRVEDCRGRRAVGYSVVLGDNNACYDRRLLLCKIQDANTALDAIIYAVKLIGQYRPDLEENMPDQLNVALSGFDVEVGEEAVPRGNYRLGMAVCNRITGLRLVNWSNRTVDLGGFDSSAQ